jgi:hypothetical protein
MVMKLRGEEFLDQLSTMIFSVSWNCLDIKQEIDQFLKMTISHGVAQYRDCTSPAERLTASQ